MLSFFEDELHISYSRSHPIFHVLPSIILSKTFVSLWVGMQNLFSFYITGYLKLQSHNQCCFIFYPAHVVKLTVIQPVLSAYPYHLVFLIWYLHLLLFHIGICIPIISLHGITVQTFECKGNCSEYSIAMGCYGCCIVPRATIVKSHWYGRYCFTEYMWIWAGAPARWSQTVNQSFVGFQSDLLHIFLK